MSRLDLPIMGDVPPRRGNGLTRLLGRFCLERAGWRFEGSFPEVPKLVIIVAPHTTNWDLVVSIAAMLALDLRIHWIGKHTIFRWPLGGLMRWLGGIPVRRDVRGGLVAQTVAAFDSRARFILALAPEGTRKSVEKWRTGFYHIAVAARASILPITYDYGRRVVRIGAAIVPSGDLDQDAHSLKAFYAGAAGRLPDGASTPTF